MNFATLHCIKCFGSDINVYSPDAWRDWYTCKCGYKWEKFWDVKSKSWVLVDNAEETDKKIS